MISFQILDELKELASVGHGDDSDGLVVLHRQRHQIACGRDAAGLEISEIVRKTSFVKSGTKSVDV